jgi:tetratricopeptide (TPR) repeat protein
MKLISQAVKLSVAAFCLVAALLQAQQLSPIAFVHVNVIAMKQEQVLKDQTVLIEGGRIAAVGPSASVKTPRNTRRIAAAGKYLIPGLTDAHVHLQTPTEFPLHLGNGVTTVFNLDGRPAHLAWRKHIDDGELLGPTIVTTGPIFERAHTAEEAVRLVDEQAALGYDAVKIYNQVSKAEYPALIAEAKRKNMLLTGHVAREPEFELTLQSGQSIAHLEEYTYTFFNPQHDNHNSHIVYDESKIPEAVRLTVQAGIFVTPTLSTYATIVQQATALDDFLKNPDLKYDAPWIQRDLQPAANRYKNGFDPPSYPRIRTSLAFQRKLVKALSDAGVPLLAGTDASDVGPVAGFGTHDELQEFVNDGLTPFQALQTATVNPARYFRRAEETGTIEPGKRADLVLLDGNPLANIANTRKIAGVMVLGRWIDSSELSQMIAAVPDSYARQVREAQHLLETDPDKALVYLDERDPFDNLAATAMTEMIKDQGVGKLRETMLAIRKKDAKSHLASEELVNNFGYALLNQKKYPEAIAVLRTNTEDFPKSANTWDSLADAQFQSGDAAHAVENYKKALEIDPKYGNAEGARKFIEEHKEGK